MESKILILVMEKQKRAQARPRMVFHNKMAAITRQAAQLIGQHVALIQQVEITSITALHTSLNTRRTRKPGRHNSMEAQGITLGTTKICALPMDLKNKSNRTALEDEVTKTATSHKLHG